MDVTTLLLLIAMCGLGFLAGFLLGGHRASARTPGSARQIIEMTQEITHWRAEAANALGRAEVLEAANSELSQRSQQEQQVASLLAPLAARISDMSERVAVMHKDQSAQEAALREQLAQAAITSQALARETTSLRSALTSASARGTWGEIELRRIVEAAGMIPHVDFSEQQAVGVTVGSGAAHGSNARPDLTVHLPGGAHLAVDSKVPLDALLRAEAITGNDPQSVAARRQHLVEHAKALRSHVKELARRDYPAQFGDSPRLTVMFLPAESLLSQALEADSGVLEYALRVGIAPATPSSLLALLRTVASVWATHAATEEAGEILKLGKVLTSRLDVVARHLDKLGSSLKSSVTHYNAAISSLENRVLVTARNFDSLEANLHSPQLIPSDQAQVRTLSAPEFQHDDER